MTALRPSGIKLEINNWKILIHGDQTFLNNIWVHKEVKKNLQYFSLNKRETTTYLWDATKTLLRRKCKTLGVYIRKGKKKKINILSFYPRKLKKKKLSSK